MEEKSGATPLYVKRSMYTRTNYLGFLKSLPVLFIWIVFLVPITLAYKLFEAVLFKLGLLKKTRDPSPPELDTSVLEKTDVPKDKREFDMIVFGATGFTGKMLAQYLARNYKFVSGDVPESRDEKEVWSMLHLIEISSGILEIWS